MALQALVIGRTLHVGQHVAVGGMRASTNVLRAKESCGVFASGVCRGFYEINVQNKIFKHFLARAIIL